VCFVADDLPEQRSESLDGCGGVEGRLGAVRSQHQDTIAHVQALEPRRFQRDHRLLDVDHTVPARKARHELLRALELHIPTHG
jgi:hypothetical protein